MGIRYHIDAERGLVVACGSGRIADDDLLDYARRLLADPERTRAKHELVDLRSASVESDVTTAGVRQIAEFWSDRKHMMAGGRLAIIAGSDVGYGLSRMYQILRSDGPDSIQVFRELDEALRWLGVDERDGRALQLPD